MMSTLTLLPIGVPPMAGGIPPLARESRAAWRYLLYGMPVHSDVRLPLQVSDGGTDAVPHWTIRLDPGPCPVTRPSQLGLAIPDPSGLPGSPGPEPAATAGEDGDGDEEDGYIAHRDRDGSLWWWCAAGTFHVQPARRRIDVYTSPGIDDRSLAAVLTGPLAAQMSYAAGYPALHASAIVTRAGAIGFLAAKGQGKSTMAAALLRRGAALLTDDLLQLRLEGCSVRGMAGPPMLRAWSSTMEHTLGLIAAALPTVTPRTQKRLLALDGWSADDACGSLAPAGGPAPLRALYVLDRRPPGAFPAVGPVVSSHPLAGRDAIAALLGNLPNGLCLDGPTRARALLFFSQVVSRVPIRVLRYASGFEHQDAVCEHALGEGSGA